MRYLNTNLSKHRAGLGAVLAVAGCLLMAACGSSQADQDASPTASAAPQATGAATPTPASAATPAVAAPRTPNATAGPKLVAAHTTLEVSNGKLTMAEHSFVADEVYFQTTYGGEDEVHSVLVVRWDGAAGGLPVDPATHTVKTGPDLPIAGGVPCDTSATLWCPERLKSGNTGLFEIEPIAPGRYVILCNEPGHYEAGEYASFEVTAPAPH